MNLTTVANSISACPDDENHLAYVYTFDRTRDYCFSLARFNDTEQDQGEVEVMVLDQVLARTKNITVTLEPTRLLATFDDETAAKLLGQNDMVVNFQENCETRSRIADTLSRIFRGIPGLTIRLVDQH